MRKNGWHVIVLAALAGAFLFGRATAQGPKPAWMNPTSEHKILEKLQGDWDLDLTFWMAPGAPPMTGTAEATYELILGGMYAQETVTSNWQGQVFEGFGIQGYDTVRKQWVGIWMDNHSPVPAVMYGTEKDGVTTMFAEQPEAMTGKLKRVKHVMAWQGDDQFTATAWDLDAAGNESRKTMEIIYKRKGGGCDEGCGCGCGCGCEEGCDDGCGCGCGD